MDGWIVGWMGEASILFSFHFFFLFSVAGEAAGEAAAVKIGGWNVSLLYRLSPCGDCTLLTIAGDLEPEAPGVIWRGGGGTYRNTCCIYKDGWNKVQKIV